MANALKVTRFGNSWLDDPLLLPLLLCDLMTDFNVVFGFEFINPADAANSRSFFVRLRLPPLPILPADNEDCEFVGLPANKIWCCCCCCCDTATGCTDAGAMYLKR